MIYLINSYNISSENGKIYNAISNFGINLYASYYFDSKFAVYYEDSLQIHFTSILIII